jgi:hypothetical protein
MSFTLKKFYLLVWPAWRKLSPLATEPSEIAAIAADYRALDAEPTRRDLIWRYGIASEILDPIRRTITGPEPPAGSPG